MSIRSLSYFLTVAEELNITTAAQKLYITQQTLSSHIKRLEDQYGVALFERRPKLRLTPAGERMVHYATRIVRLERMMNSEFGDFSKKSGGVLLVGCSRIRAKYFFPEIWQAYQELCPNIEVRMKEGNSSRMDEYMLSRKVDLCISLNSSEQLHLKKELLMHESIYFVISIPLFEQYFGDRAVEKRREFTNGIRCQDILGIPLILQPDTNYIRRIINRHFMRLDVVPRAIFESNDSELIFNMCLTSCGAALLPETTLFLPQGLDPQMLHGVYIFPLKDIRVSSVISYPVDMELPHYERVFIDICKDVFEEGRKKIENQKRLILNSTITTSIISEE